MLYWRELGPQSGQYSINIGVKVSIKFTFSSIDTTRTSYIYMVRSGGRRPFLHITFVLLLDVPQMSKQTLVPCRNLSEFRLLIVCTTAIIYEILRVTHVKQFFYEIFRDKLSFYVIGCDKFSFIQSFGKNCINDLSNWKSCKKSLFFFVGQIKYFTSG